MKAVLVTGSRYWPFVRGGEVMVALERENPDLVIVGDARGVDGAARAWAESNCDVMVCRADWDRMGKAAGPVRNKRMVDFLAALPSGWERVGLAFPSGESPGTRGCIRLLKAAGIPVKVFE